MINDCTALIMAGGQSQRMGQDKASLLLGEQSLLQHVSAIVLPMFAQVVVSVRAPRPDIALPQVCDTYPDAGPLAGLYAGLSGARTAWVFAVATDMPFVRTKLIEQLAALRADLLATGAERPRAIVPVVGGHPQPLAAFYARDSLPVIEGLLASEGRCGLRTALARLPVRYVEEAELRAADPELSSFFDLDTPEDLARAGKRSA